MYSGKAARAKPDVRSLCYNRVTLRLRYSSDSVLRGGRWTTQPAAVCHSHRTTYPSECSYLHGSSTWTSKDRFRIATTDYAGAILLPKLLEDISSVAPRVRLEVVAWNTAGVASVEAGRVDIAIVGVYDVSSLESEELFTDRFVCLVSQAHPLQNGRLTLRRYLSYAHVEIAVTNGRSPRIDDTLAELGFARRIAFCTPFSLSAILATSRSEMIYTMPCRLGVLLAPMAKGR